MRPEETGSLKGQTVGNYQVLSLIGSGAMGEVYLAEHPQIGRRVAVKVMVPQYSQHAEVAARFMSEARAVNTINHPNIIQIFDFGQLPDGRLYYTMEHLEGAPLTQLIRERAPLALRETEELLHQITDALDAAHAAGIVHRDLKPDNIFIKETPGGRFVKVLDFGIAKLLDTGMGSQHRTSTGMIMGTPLYMSPEQAAGETHLISPRSDVYALGVITYQLLSARLPIEAPTTAQVLAKHITEPPTPLCSVASGLPPPLCAVVESALAKEPASRPQSAGQLFAAFQQAITGADLDAPPTTVGSPVVRPPGASASGAFQGKLATQPTTLGSTASESLGSGLAGRRRTGLWVGLAAVVLVAAGVGAFFGLGLDGRGQGKQRTATAEGMAAARGPSDETARRADPGSVPTPRDSAARPAERAAPRLKVFTLQVRTDPSKAKVEVTVAGQPSFKKTAPFALEVKEGERVSLRASRAGYLEQTESLLATADKTVQLTLERRRPGYRPRPVARPEPPRVIPVRPRPVMSTVGEGTLKPPL